MKTLSIIAIIILVTACSSRTPKSVQNFQERNPASAAGVVLDTLSSIRQDARLAINNLTKPASLKYAKNIREKIASFIPAQNVLILADGHYLTTLEVAEWGKTPGNVMVKLTMHSKSKENFNHIAKLTESISEDSALRKKNQFEFESFMDKNTSDGYLLRGTNGEAIHAYNGWTVKFDLALATEKQLNKIIELFSDQNFVSAENVRSGF